MSYSLIFLEFYNGWRLQDILHILFRSFTNFFLVYAFAGVWLFAVIGWTVVLGFRSLGSELRNNNLLLASTDNQSEAPEGKEDELIELLTKWKRLHVLLCDTVDGINDCLGPVLLIWVAHIFIGFISTPFYVVGSFHSTTASSYVIMAINIFLMIMQVVHLFVITGISSRIWHEVSKLI